jgi:hypothetical protein
MFVRLAPGSSLTFRPARSGSCPGCVGESDTVRDGDLDGGLTITVTFAPTREPTLLEIAPLPTEATRRPNIVKDLRPLTSDAVRP